VARNTLDDQARELVEAICDHFSTTQLPYGRPDPRATEFASGDLTSYVACTQFHSPVYMALALYEAAERLDREDYLRAADLYVLWMAACFRDPFGGRWDWYTEQLATDSRKESDAPVPRNQQWHHLYSRSWTMGFALEGLCRGLLVAHPGETSFLSKTAALYEWLQEHRTDQGHYYNIGYSPSGLPGDRKLDGAFSCDLGTVGQGLASYYQLCGRVEVLEDLKGLARYFLNPHQENSASGCFSEEMGSWVACPWAIEIKAEHVIGAQRLDKLCWGFSNREAIDFLTRLYRWVEDEPTKQLICKRVVRAMKWAFDDCQFDDGAVGMTGRDDAFTGMAGAAILNYADCFDAGMLDEEEARQYGEKARRAYQWILSWSKDQIISRAGYEKRTGSVSLRPPENLAWMLAWTARALLRGLPSQDSL
jgi:hypothetical protein